MAGKRYGSKRAQEIRTQVLGRVVLVAMSLLFLAPILWMVSTSLKDSSQVMAYPPVWFPWPPKWENYKIAVNAIPFALYLKNTVTICVLSIIGTLLSSTLVAYSLAKIPWPGRNVLLLLILSTMMLPFPVTMIPLFVTFARLGWINTFKPLVVPAFLGNAFYIFLLRQFFMTIPAELSDAARIDGASELGIFARVVLPLSKPVLAVVALFQFLGSWNDFLGPLIYLQSNEKYTLAIGLQMYRTTNWVEWELLMAASTLVVIPILILFFFAQRTFIEGIAITGIKG
ncbi:MAG: carbohydrate ABC transporter permease [Firmicutes bacterium]|nr:carbohydrate ABC transporter permease [Bacillota bacterium]